MPAVQQDQYLLPRFRSSSRSIGDFVELSDAETSSNPNRSSYELAAAYPSYRSSTPLIDRCTNDWQHSAQWKYDSDDTVMKNFEVSMIQFPKRLSAMLRAPKMRRYVVFYAIVFIISAWLWTSFLHPVWIEHQLLIHSISLQNNRESSSLYGMSVRAEFTDIIHLGDLDPQFVPTAATTQDADHVRRLIFIGDVNNCVEELQALLDKIRFNHDKDHLVFTGNLITQGANATATVEYLRGLDASCVRGVHEDRVLLAAQTLDFNLASSQSMSSQDSGNIPLDTAFETPYHELARQFSVEHIEFLRSCPVILRVGFVEDLASEIVVVHGGLVPGLPLDHQDSTAVMSMRSIELDTHIPSREPDRAGAMPWIKLWNKYQQSLPARWPPFLRSQDENKKRPITVIYGHDSQSGLQLRRYSKGIDTDCVSGGQLTALIMSSLETLEPVQVDCRDHRQHPSLEAEFDEILEEERIKQDDVWSLD